MKVKAALVGIEGITERLKNSDKKIKEDMRKAVSLAAIDLTAKVKLKLSDDVLHVRTGTLRRSITHKIIENQNGFVAIVGTNLKYGAVHEYGFQGPENVKEHNRKISKAFGRPLTRPTIFKVKAHVRNVVYPERSFLRTALDENIDKITLTFKQSLEKSAKEILNG